LNNIVTLKSGLEITQVIETGAIRKLGWGFLFTIHSNYGLICSRLWDIQRQRVMWPWKQGYGSLKVIGNGTIW